MKNLVGFGIKSEFVRNVSKLMTGTILSQVFPILAAPILSRIYLPENYGVLGLYMSVTGMISMLTTLQYTNAIIIAKDEDEAKSLIKLCLQSLTIFTIASIIAVIFLREYISVLLKSENLSIWLYAAPASIFMNGLAGIFGNYAIRNKLYNLVSSNRIAGSLISTSCSMLVGYIYKNPIGLFIGLWIGQIINGIIMAIRTLKLTKNNLNIIFKCPNNKVHLKYIDFPKYSLPADFINNFTNQIPLLMLNAYGSAASVGNYNMSNRILGLPSSFISSALGDVFKQRASKDYHNIGNCKSIFIKTFVTLSLVSIIPFTIIILFGPAIFSFFLGQKWVDAGKYSQIMGILFFFRFTISPLTYVYYIANKQNEDFWLHLLFLLVSYISFYIGYLYTNSTNISLLLFSLLYSGIYCIYLVRSYQFSLGETRLTDLNKIP